MVRKAPESCSSHKITGFSKCQVEIDTGEKFWKHSGKKLGSTYETNPVILEASPEEIWETLEAEKTLRRLCSIAQNPKAIYFPIDELKKILTIMEKLNNDN